MRMTNDSMNDKEEKLEYLTYSDYRKLIEDFFEQKNKKTKGRFSYRAFSKLAGFSSPSFISQVVQGNKNLSNKGIHGLAMAMKLTARERDFFENLVFFNQAKTHDEKNHYFKKICSFKEFTEAHQISYDQYEYLSQWYNVAIRELIALPDFKMNLFWISKKLKPNITVTQAKQTIELLQRLQLITQDEKGKWTVTNSHLKTEHDIMIETSASNFHYEMITRARESLDHDQTTRDISSLTMSISEDQYKHIKGMVAELRDQIQKYLSENPQAPIKVIQLNHQIFSLTE